jgi:beta-RFAP synthase
LTRQFGGVGLMIEDPGIEIRVEPAASWSFDGPLAPRVGALVRRLLKERGHGSWSGSRLESARISVLAAPPEHVGLGVGTQISLAVTRALLELGGAHDCAVETLARLSGRGRRSGVGIHGFDHGGLIVDGGRREESDVPPLVARTAFPQEWSILLVQPSGPCGRHGSEEAQAFARLPPPTDLVSDRLCRLVLLGLLPAVVERDLESFGAALSEIQHHIGSAFAPLQGGVYASREAESLIAQLGSLGLAGAGQSSWGPTLYAFGCVTEGEQRKIVALLLDRNGLDPAAIRWTKAANHAATLVHVEN